MHTLCATKIDTGKLPTALVTASLGLRVPLLGSGEERRSPVAATLTGLGAPNVPSFVAEGFHQRPTVGG